MLDNLMLKIYTQNKRYLLFYHDNNGYANAPQCYVIRQLPVLYDTCYTSDMGPNCYLVSRLYL